MKRGCIASFSTAFFRLGAALLLTACPSSQQQSGTDAGATGPAEGGATLRVKKVDLDACDAGVQEMERLAKAAKKTCGTSAECTEWIRNGNCGSIPVGRPFPPPDSATRWEELQKTTAVSCPDEPRCKWASLGVECRAGTCVPSLEGRLEPDGGY